MKYGFQVWYSQSSLSSLPSLYFYILIPDGEVGDIFAKTMNSYNKNTNKQFQQKRPCISFISSLSRMGLEGGLGMQTKRNENPMQ